MRFRAEVKDVQAFLPTLQAFLQSGDMCVLVFGPERTRLLMHAEHTQGEQIYADMPTSCWSDNCRVESQQQNQIPLLVYLPNLIKAFKSCVRCERCLIRLSKHSNRAFLTFEAWSGEQSVVQDVPVLVQSMRSLEQWEEPLLDDPKVKLTMPAMQILHTLADKMKGVSDILDIEASSDGQLKLSVGQSQVKITSTFSGLKLQPALVSAAQAATPLSSHAESPAQNLIAHVLQQEQQREEKEAAEAAAAAAAAAAVAGDEPTGMEIDGAQNSPGPAERAAAAAAAAAPTAAAAAAAPSAAGASPAVPAAAVAGLAAGFAPSPLPAAVGPSISPSALGSAMDGSSQQPPSEHVETVRARVAIRKFANITATRQIQIMHSVACIVEEAAFVVYLKLRNKRGNITYYLPLVAE